MLSLFYFVVIFVFWTVPCTGLHLLYLSFPVCGKLIIIIIIIDFRGYEMYGAQGRSQDFLKGGSSTSIELLEAGVWGRSPQPLRDFQYFNKLKLSKLLYFMQKVH